MRITTNMMMRNYNSRLNRVLGDLNLKNEKVTMNGRKYLKASEDPTTAVRAYQLRRSYKETEDHIANVQNVRDALLTSESSVEAVSQLADSVYVRSLEAINGTHTVEDRMIYAEELRGIQDSMVMNLNAKFDNKFLFGGTGTTEAPFELIRNEDGSEVLTYRGIDVTTGLTYPQTFYEKDADGNIIVDANGNPTTPRDPNEPDAEELAAGAEVLKALANEEIFKDLGFGLEEDANEDTVNNTAYNSALPGLDITGFGMQENVPLEDVHGNRVMIPTRDDDDYVILDSSDLAAGTKIYQPGPAEGTKGSLAFTVVENANGDLVLKPEVENGVPIGELSIDSEGKVSLEGFVDENGNAFEGKVKAKMEQATTTVHKNLILNIGELARLFEATDKELDYPKIKACTDMLDDQRMDVLKDWTDIGTNTQFLETTLENLETSQFHLNEKIINVEYDDMEEAIMAFQEADYIYRAALKMGMNVLSPSFIDFMS